jgi:hypothetical protein
MIDNISNNQNVSQWFAAGGVLSLDTPVSSKTPPQYNWNIVESRTNIPNPKTFVT